MQDLSGKFYTIIPHAFGMCRPPVIDNMEMLRAKFDMVAVLGDIEIAQTLQTKEESHGKHPTTVKYEQLESTLKPIDKTSTLFQTIKKVCRIPKTFRCS
jgi:poly [ADP-ribose] polymerase